MKACKTVQRIARARETLLTQVQSKVEQINMGILSSATLMILK